MRLNPYGSRARPALAGHSGAISAAHPLAVAAGQEMLFAGGSAVDAVIAAQAALSVVAPDACGLGGDAFLLVRDPEGDVTAVNGAGAAGRRATEAAPGGGLSVSVPGMVSAWDAASERWGKLSLAKCLQPAIRLARWGVVADAHLLETVDAHRTRLGAGGAGAWSLLAQRPGQTWMQPELALALERIAKMGRAGFYSDAPAQAIAAAVAAANGALDEDDLAAHRSETSAPLQVDWGDTQVFVQPPMSQGVLLATALANLARRPGLSEGCMQHVAVELTEAAFQLRDRAGEGGALLEETLDVDVEHASKRGGPRAYLHTAGVAASDRFGFVVSSLASVFDDFGSGLYVAEGGFVLNNRAGGFTQAPNHFAPGKMPVHTLAPIIVRTPEGVVALATPGADGQVQTLLQILIQWRTRGDDLAHALHAPRWRSENAGLLIERGHPDREALAARGHDLEELAPGDTRFGAVTSAGLAGRTPFAVADWRRLTWAGVA